MKIVFVGSGNVATQLGIALKAAGEEIIQVFSRNLLHASALAETLGSQPVADFKQIRTDADLYLISVKDDAIHDVASHLPANQGLIVHTSGTTELKVLHPHQNIGVFYPLQTFSKAKPVDFAQIPICLEASDEKFLQQLKALADRISKKVFFIDGEKRKALHVAAVFACNFSNHLYHIANQFLGLKKLEFDMLRPLIAETADKVMQDLPEAVQTGPAIRHDEITITRHMDMLNEMPEWQKIYQLLSDSIKKSYE